MRTHPGMKNILVGFAFGVLFTLGLLWAANEPLKPETMMTSEGR